MRISWCSPVKKTYHGNCTELKGDDIEAMVDQEKEISLRTMRKNCDISELEKLWGYAIGHEKGLHLKDDWAIRCFKSKYKGKPCYFICHSAIEYVYL